MPRVCVKTPPQWDGKLAQKMMKLPRPTPSFLNQQGLAEQVHPRSSKATPLFGQYHPPITINYPEMK